jgi:drug/metabolite transporter (DMT)-like permease
VVRSTRLDTVVFLVGVAAALVLGLGYVLQQRVAETVPLSELLTFRLLLDLIRKPVWLAGIGCMIVGELLAGLALQLATVAVVEPLLSTTLLFALGFAAALAKQRIHWHEVSGALLLSAALGTFIAVGNPHSSQPSAPTAAVVGLAVGVLAIVVVVLVAIGKRLQLVGESVLLASAAGLLYGLQDAATRALLQLVDHHQITAFFVKPWVYLIIGAAIVGILLSQSAFKAARLNYSLPPIVAAEPIAGIALGVILLGDQVSVSILGLSVESLCLVAMLAGVALIGRSRNLAAHGAPAGPADAEADNSD